MKVKVLILCTLLLICNSAFAQEVIKQEETGNLWCDDFITRMENLIIGLKENPNSNGYILVYEGKMKYNNEGKQIYLLPHFGEAQKYIS